MTARGSLSTMPMENDERNAVADTRLVICSPATYKYGTRLSGLFAVTKSEDGSCDGRQDRVLARWEGDTMLLEKHAHPDGLDKESMTVPYRVYWVIFFLALAAFSLEAYEKYGNTVASSCM